MAQGVRGEPGEGVGASVARCTVQWLMLGCPVGYKGGPLFLVPCHSLRHLATKGMGKAAAVVFRRLASLENK